MILITAHSFTYRKLLLYRNRVTKLAFVPANQLLANPDNARQHPSAQREALRGSLDTLGWAAPVIVNQRTGYLLDGHARVEESLTADENAEIPVAYVDLDEAEEAQFLVSFDWITTLATYDREKTEALLQRVQSDDERVQAMLSEQAEALDLSWGDGTEAVSDTGESPLPLTDRFLIPPFSVLDARQGYWIDRRRAWLSIGIQSEIGRKGGHGEGGLTFAKSAQSPAIYSLRNKMRSRLGYDPSWDEIIAEAKAKGLYLQRGTSLFDPVLCEVAYTWFCPPRGAVLDPFAGGSVRGIVASKLGRSYTGVELRQEQVAANVEQGATITPDAPPRWVVGDSANIDTLAPGGYDLVFTCPPYADLEVYSDDPRDISNMAYDDFLTAYKAIIAKSCAMLRDNRFAVVVVGEVRDKYGNYYNFVGDTIMAFLDAGLHFYNEAILITPLASIPLRAANSMKATRKLGKTHQNVLVFVKGDGRAATEACGPVEVYLDAVLGEGAE